MKVYEVKFGHIDTYIFYGRHVSSVRLNSPLGMLIRPYMSSSKLGRGTLLGR